MTMKIKKLFFGNGNHVDCSELDIDSGGYEFDHSSLGSERSTVVWWIVEFALGHELVWDECSGAIVELEDAKLFQTISRRNRPTSGLFLGTHYHAYRIIYSAIGRCC